MNDSQAQQLLAFLAEHGDAFTHDQWKKFQRDLDRHELAKDAAYLKWEAGIDDDDTD